MYPRRFCVVLLVLVWGLVLPSVAAGADPNLVGWWRLDEGAGDVALDSSGQENHGALSDAAWVVPGWNMTGACVELDRVGFVDLGNPDAINFGNVDWTVTAWVNTTITGTSESERGTIFANGGDWGGGIRFTLCVAELTEGMVTLTCDDDSTKVQVTATTAVNDGEWHFVVGQREATTVRVYTDGVAEGENTVPATYNLSGTSQHNAYLGAITDHRDASLKKTYAGLIDDVRIFSAALSADELVSVMLDAGDPELAADPSPEDEAVDVPHDTILAWTPGEFAASHDVYVGTVFDDVNDADRADARGTLVGQGQAATTYAPDGVWEFGQTYYWRIDEVNAAPDNTIFAGEVWSFTVEPLAYEIQGVIASSNAASDPGVGPERTVDGSGLNESDQHSVGSDDMWLGSAGADPVWLQYEFDRIYKLHEILVWNYNIMFEPVLGFGVKDVTIEYSEDGAEWMVLGDVELAQATAREDYVANTAVDMAGVAAKFVRITVNSNYGSLPQYGLSEVRFLQIPVGPREPAPADGASDVSIDAGLGWRSGREAATHDVYFGTDAEALSLAGSTDAPSYDPGALNLDTTYYWRVDEVNEAEAISLWEGDVWSFDTQEFLIVDDFESYDDEDNRIYDTWLDGWINETGSTVGHLDSPFAEQMIVNSGSQSMPLFYDNAGLTTAEAERSLGQNWTTNGVQSLSVAFYGVPDNTGQLYVKVNGTKVAYDGDITTAAWQSFTIDLSTVGNMSNVNSLVIGVEGAGASGVVYIDDVRLGGPPLEPSYSYDGDALDDAWDHDNGSDQWDGTGPGEGRPGGAAALVEDDVTFLRIQDTGDPRDYDMGDPGSNRKVYLTRQTDTGLDGLRLEFCIRVATSAPLDDMHPDGGAGIEAWPAEGIAYHVRDGGKGMIGIAEAGLGVISFSLARGGQPGLEDVTGDVLVMHNLVGTEPSGDVDTEDTAEAIVARNWVAVDDVTQWNTFAVDIAAGGAGTHTVSVSVNDGEAVAFDITAGDGLEGDGSYLAVGSSGTGGITAFDVDYVSYFLPEE